MRLFGKFEAVRFPEENKIFITKNGYLYYIYHCDFKRWEKFTYAGEFLIKVRNYPDVTGSEIFRALNGVSPQRETDFERLCDPSELSIVNFLDLLREDYKKYMSDMSIQWPAHNYLLESEIPHQAYLKLRELFDKALKNYKNNEQVRADVLTLTRIVTGRNFFKPEIGIVDGHANSSFFWIMPVRVIDYKNIGCSGTVAAMKAAEISIEEDDVAQYLSPFLFQYFDEGLKANKMRSEVGFDWNLTHNFFTFDDIRNILKDIYATVDVLSSGRENEYTVKIKEDSRFKTEAIIDFYRRFTYRMEYMIKVGAENGFDLISFEGP